MHEGWCGWLGGGVYGRVWVGEAGVTVCSYGRSEGGGCRWVCDCK